MAQVRTELPSEVVPMVSNGKSSNETKVAAIGEEALEATVIGVIPTIAPAEGSPRAIVTVVTVAAGARANVVAIGDTDQRRAATDQGEPTEATVIGEGRVRAGSRMTRVTLGVVSREPHRLRKICRIQPKYLTAES